MESTITDFAHLQIPLEDIAKATNNFAKHNIIGGGGFGRAYKGQLLRSGNLMKIVALRLDRRYGLGDVEFKTEISMLYDLKHTNLVSLIGFCDEKHEKIIIIKHEAKGSLKEHLNSPILTWTQRLKISVGVARALSYIHHDEGRDYGVIHRNINSSTILLDENLEAKLSGFLVSVKQSANRMEQVVLCEPTGSIGYMDPIIEKSKGVTPKSDIYSLGVVLFEILCGREAYINDEVNMLLAPLAIHHYKQKTLKDIMHPNLFEILSQKSFEIYSTVAYFCLNDEQALRPHAENIVAELERALESQLQRENLINNLERLKIEHLKIPLTDIRLATNNFSKPNIEYTGGPIEWYTVELNLHNENPSSVEGKNKCDHPKRLSTVSIKRYLNTLLYGEKVFFSEIEKLTSLKHPNIVTLHGFCVEESELILVIENLSNGNLGSYFQNNEKRSILTWEKRLKICIDVAQALNYLHSEMECQKIIINRDVCSFSIGLDDNWGAKIVNFWYSMFLSPNQEEEAPYFSTTVYQDPEYEKTGELRRELDVYSFGVVLFEILCGRVAYDPIYMKSSEKGLAHLARCRVYKGTIEDMIDPLLRKQSGENNFVSNRGPSKHSLHTFIEIANQCVIETQDQRPPIKVVVNELRKALSFQENPIQGQDINQAVNELEKPVESMVKNLERLKIEHLKIPLTYIKLATNNFSEPLMDGPFEWYTVELNLYNKENPLAGETKNNDEHPKGCITVDIKRYPFEHYMYGEKAFFTEIEKLTILIKHPNIVTLHGFCVEDSEMILVIENFSNGYLGDHFENIEKRRVLTWEKRLKICIDVAQALQYLHSTIEDQKFIVNRSIHCNNIGLDENWRAKIVDFWFSVFLSTNQKEEIPHQRGTVYDDPVYEKTGELRSDVDIYSFGVVLFEVLCGRKAYDQIYMKRSGKGLVPLARSHYYNGTLEDMIDPLLKEESGESNFARGPNKYSLETFIYIANLCVSEIYYERPSTNQLLYYLEKALDFQVNHVQRQGIDQVVNKPEKPFELGFPHGGIPGKNLKHLMIPLVDIESATENFSERYIIMETTRCFTLYKARLECFDKENGQVVIKRFHPGNDREGEEMFYSEINILTNVRHPNIVKLCGFCVEGSEMILVIENISNGYLGTYLETRNTSIFTWEKRLKICVDIAHALNYLHRKTEDKMIIINRNIRSYFIGLDENWEAKICEFGYSVFLSPNQEEDAQYYDIVRGTSFYVDPEYEKTGKFKRGSDVYSFGVVLFEILCGRLVDDPIYLKENEKGLAYVARRRFITRTIEDMMDSIIKEEIGENNFVLNRGPNKLSLHVFLEIARQCVSETQDQRPTMEVVVKELEKALSFEKNNMDNHRMSLEDIKKATQNFNNANFLGEGGFGTVYKGKLHIGDGVNTIVAKRLKFVQKEQQFLSELQIVLEYKHKNVIGLLGYCDEKDEKIIVYEYASRGSLDRHLKRGSLTWMQRLGICIDVASALDFLHGGVGKQAKVIHRDIKTANILLNHDWKAKLADFGLSLISPITKETDYVIDHKCGTPGYVDPLYEKFKFLTIESDIYSFGVVLFEILGGRLTHEIKEEKGHHLPDFIIKNEFKAGKLDEMVFKEISEQIKEKSLIVFQNIAYQCLHPEREKRPTAKKVLKELKKALQFQNMESIMTKLKHLYIPLEEVAKATNNFHDDNIIERGGFGTTIYEGSHSQFGNIAARRFDCKHGEGDLQFLTEISILSHLNHTNLVSVIGFCDEQNEKIIITSYESNGSLGQHLNSSNLTWTQRLKICLGVARALCCLEGGDYAVIHCNINSDTIFLDENLEAKLSGFEISIKESACNKDLGVLCEHAGTMGYTDPTIEKTGGTVTHKSDIYSFGVVLFEILCGRKAFIQNDADMFLVPLAKYHYESQTLHDIIFPHLVISPQSLLKYSALAYSCLNDDRASRPSMNNIIGELKDALELQLPFQYIEENLKHLKIPLTRIQFATENFSQTYITHSDWTSTFYRAKLHRFDKQNPSSVDIKRMLCGQEENFVKEIEVRYRLKHNNIVPLFGFCIEASEMILVNETAFSGILFDYLQNCEKLRILTWEKRLKICIDVAYALNHLHSRMEDEKEIIHCDLSSYNIGLDENIGAKIIYYFVFTHPNQEDVALHLNWLSKQVYLDQKSKETYQLKKEYDVYSFGVFLFEIMRGRTTYHPDYLKESNEGLYSLAREFFCRGTLEEITDPHINDETNENNFFLRRRPNKDSLHKFIRIARQCVATGTQGQRPTMEVVIKELEYALFLHKKDLRIPLEDIKLATKNFHDDNCIGEGKFGKFYKGNLQDGDLVNTIIAKRLETRLGQGEKQFLNELQILWEYKHGNVIGLVGYCDEQDEKVIVYEFASRGNLEQYVNNASLTWRKRLNICIDIASALDVIHGGVGKQTKVIHGDIKTANILLNQHWKAKLADFGLSIISPITQETEKVINYACGTRGYMDPLYEKSGCITTKSDIYSFGVVLFEMLCGRSTFAIHEHEGHYLPEFIKRAFEKGKHDEVVFEQIREQIKPKSLTTFQKIAYQCLHYETKKRPKAKEVLKQLKKALKFQISKDQPGHR